MLAAALAGGGGSAASPPSSALSASAPVAIRAADVGALEAWSPRNLRELFTGSDTVVVGRVTSVGPGEPLVGAQHRDPHLNIPTERAVVEVESVVASAPGVNAPSGTVDLYSTVPHPADGVDPVVGGTGVESGGRYVLFLRESNQTPGRYWTSASGTFLPVVDDRVGAPRRTGMEVGNLEGRPLPEAADELRRARRTINDNAFGAASPNAQIANRAEIREAFRRGPQTGREKG